MLAGAAEKIGLDRKSALTAAAHGLADGILLWREGKISVNELIHEAATPGGIAATVMDAMDKAGYQGMVERALRAGLARAKVNARA
jgi:pyrroline-5-carboxylate reductase